MERNEAIERIRKALKQRSGKAWSVTGGRGTAWGWIRITSPPARRKREGSAVPSSVMAPEDQIELSKLLGFRSESDTDSSHAYTKVHCQGCSIAASTDYRQEYVDRAEGREPSVIGTPYWD